VSEYRRPIAKGVLGLIVAAYCVLGLTYAVQTPRWETPDEPAHYNYVVDIAEKHRLPVLQTGDYPHEYLEEIKAAKFPPPMSIASIRYESHQPPLYYLGAAVLYKVTGSLGAEEFLALITTAMIATVPMHIAMSAAVNNDTLAELILAFIILLCTKHLKSGLSTRQVAVLGFLLALALLTKTGIYVPAVLSIVFAFAVRARFESARGLLQQVALTSGLALLSAWWFVRNVLTYGNLDLFGWQRHDSVVVGQPTTAQWISEHGLFKTIRDFFIVSFRSFWAQFGWMGILIDSRLYALLGLVSVVVGVGFILFLLRAIRHRQAMTRFQRWALILLLLVFVVVTAEHMLYNVKFVQHQGRYLFPALVPFGLAFALGLREWTSICTRLISHLPLPERLAVPLPDVLKGIAFGLSYVGFLVLDVVCLYLFIVPHFQA
jgi:hypothetical protein